MNLLAVNELGILHIARESIQYEEFRVHSTAKRVRLFAVKSLVSVSNPYVMHVFRAKLICTVFKS